MDLTELKKLYVIELRNNPNINSEQTINSYVASVTKFYNENSRIYRMTKDDIKKYLSGIRQKYSDSYYNVIGSSIKILFDRILKQPNKMNWFQSIKPKRKFFDIISHDEFISMMKNTDQIKHKLIIILLYSTGIRLSELLSIKLSDIDYLNKRIFINTLKGGKNRYVPLHELVVKYLESYFKKWKPVEYLIEGQKGGIYTSSSVQHMIKRVSNGKYTPHSFRHTFLSTIVEKEDVFFAMELAGHNSLRSTMHYNHIAADRLKTMFNPLDKQKVA
jgi:integrase